MIGIQLRFDLFFFIRKVLKFVGVLLTATA